MIQIIQFFFKAGIFHAFHISRISRFEPGDNMWSSGLKKVTDFSTTWAEVNIRVFTKISDIVLSLS